MRALVIILSCLLCPALYSQVPGELDVTFGSLGKILHNYSLSSSVTDMDLQPDGKIVAVGSKDNEFFVMRLNSDGSLDPTFGQSGIVQDSVLGDAWGIGIKVDAAGKILITGYTRYWGAGWLEDLFVTRLLSDGSFDATFGVNGTFVSYISQNVSPTKLNAGKKIIELSDGNILIGGTFDYGTSVNPDFAVFKITASGQFDNSFGTNGYVYYDVSGNDQVKGFAIQNNGKILITGGMFNPVQVPVLRLNTNGSLDSSFGVSGIAIIDFSVTYQSGTDLKQTSGEKILLAGYRSNGSGDRDYFISRLDSLGQVDTSFGTNGFSFYDNGFHEEPTSLIELPDGNIILSGSTGPFTDFTSDMLLVCFDNTGIINTSFSGDGSLIVDFSGYIDGINCSLMQPDGKIVASGKSIDISAGIGYSPFIRLYSTYVGINEVSSKGYEFRLFPNPANEYTTIHINPGLEDLPEAYEILDMSGKIVSTGKVKGEFTRIYLKDFSSSVYMVRLIRSNLVLGSQIIVLKH